MHDHLIKIDGENLKLEIYRVYKDGYHELFTSVSLPEEGPTKDQSAFSNFARLLGENILVDSPIARRALKL